MGSVIDQSWLWNPSQRSCSQPGSRAAGPLWQVAISGGLWGSSEGQCWPSYSPGTHCNGAHLPYAFLPSLSPSRRVKSPCSPPLPPPSQFFSSDSDSGQVNPVLTSSSQKKHISKCLQMTTGLTASRNKKSSLHHIQRPHSSCNK